MAAEADESYSSIIERAKTYIESNGYLITESIIYIEHDGDITTETLIPNPEIPDQLPWYKFQIMDYSKSTSNLQ